MSANSKIDLAGASSTTEPTQAECIRSAMSFDKILVQPTTTTEMTEAPMLDTPSTPPKSLNQEASSPVAPSDIAMTEPAELGSIPEEFLEDGEDVPDSQREFICMNDEHSRCQTGQYTKDLSRKVISDHFGRNKACTRDITDWPLFCRKHYQRATYSKAKWQIRKVQLIFRQLDVIEKQFPGTTYDIAFKKSEEARLNQYSRYVAAGMSNEEAEQRVAPVPGKNFEAPIDVLRELDQCLGRGKSYEEVKEIVDVILQMLEAHECEQVPSIEFLPQLPAKYATPAKTPVKARAAKSPKSPNTPSRVSDKGAVKKTSRDA